MISRLAAQRLSKFKSKPVSKKPKKNKYKITNRENLTENNKKMVDFSKLAIEALFGFRF